MKNLVLICCPMLIAINCLAGGWTSSGGVGVHCKANNSFKLYDLEEARVLYGFKYEYDRTKTIVENAREKVAQIVTLVPNIEFHLSDIFENDVINFRTVDTSEYRIPDASGVDYSIYPKKCDLETVAAYRSNNELFFDKDFWAMMEDLDKSALLVHEALYTFLRVFDGENSPARARKVVAHLFAKNQPLEAVDSELKDYRAIYKCSNSENSGIIYRSHADPSQYRYQVEKTEKLRMLSHSYIDFSATLKKSYVTSAKNGIRMNSAIQGPDRYSLAVGSEFEIEYNNGSAPEQQYICINKGVKPASCKWSKSNPRKDTNLVPCTPI